MSAYKTTLKSLFQLLSKIESDIDRSKKIISQLIDGEVSETDMNEIVTHASKLLSYEEDEIKVIEGVYDGYFMVGSDEKKYPVPLNYSSKTKLVPGDVLKLRIMADGKLLYKLIDSAPRNFVKATLSQSDDKYVAIADNGKSYILNQAAVTYFRGKAGDEMTIIVNPQQGDHAAIEALFSSD